MSPTSFPAPEDLKGTIQGTLLYLFVYAAILIPFQSFSKFYILAQRKAAYARAKKDGTPLPEKTKANFTLSVKYYNNEDYLALAGDRAVGNFLEQALIFLPLFWMHALWVDPSQSLTIAVVYTISRAIYPIVYLLNFSGYMGAIGLSTGPGYLVTIYLFYQVAVRFAFA